MRHVDALVSQAVEGADDPRTVTFEHCADYVVERLPCCNSEARRHRVRGDPIVGDRDELIQQSQRVSHRPGRLAGHNGDRLVVRRQGLRIENRAHPLSDEPVGDQSKIVLLTSRADRHRHLVAFGGREDELHVIRRLLQRLQEGVERARRQHVNLIDDDDLVAVALGPVRERFLETAHVFDAVVRRPVDLLDVHVDARRDVEAGAALVARGRSRALFAVERFGEQACRGGLADATNPREQEGVRDAIGVDGVAERSRNVLLTD